jgi:hypothetical protein
MLKYKTGIDILHIPYRGGADTLNDVLPGSVHMMNEPVSLPHVKAGKLILLNVNSQVRHPDFPNVPTLTELGITGADVPIWFSIFAPAGTPKEVQAKIEAERHDPEAITRSHLQPDQVLYRRLAHPDPLRQLRARQQRGLPRVRGEVADHPSLGGRETQPGQLVAEAVASGGSHVHGHLLVRPIQRLNHGYGSSIRLPVSGPDLVVRPRVARKEATWMTLFRNVTMRKCLFTIGHRSAFMRPCVEPNEPGRERTMERRGSRPVRRTERAR